MCERQSKKPAVLDLDCEHENKLAGWLIPAGAGEAWRQHPSDGKDHLPHPGSSLQVPSPCERSQSP